MTEEKQRQSRQTLTYDSSVASLFGCCGLFDLCSDDDILSLSLQGADPFLDWLGWRKSAECVIHKNFITFIRPEQSGGVCTEGYLADPCADPYSYEWGECDFRIEDFGRIRREGPVRDMTMNHVRYCENEPRWRIDGTRVTDEREHDALKTAEVILQDIRRYTITGNAATGGLYDGLEQLVVNNYTDSNGRRCSTMDSMVFDWNGNTMAGGAGITYNGAAIAATYNFVDVLLDVMRRLKQRISYAPALNRPLAVGDYILLMPTFMTRCLLDHYTCWSVCDGAQYNEVNMNTHEARRFRNSLNGGMFGAGRIFLDGYEIPLLPYDWELINGPTTGDIYLLNGSLGNVKTMYYEHLDMATVAGSFSELGMSSFESGRFLRWMQQDNTCYKQLLEIRPRILSWAPWLNARFQDVVCGTPTGPLSPDPCETSFFPETSFSVAACP